MDDLERWDFWSWRKPTKKVEGGIKARAKKFGESWWAEQWLELLPSKSRNRLARGRTYARKGQITEFSVRPGRISGKIQGSADEPYEVQIWAPVVQDSDREMITKAIKTKPLFAAKFLNREMPVEVPALFRENGAQLFPAATELVSDCDCPDAANPCKHIAAVFYLFSLELESDPMLLLYFRGFERGRLLIHAPVEMNMEADEEPLPDPLPVNPKDFWKPYRPVKRERSAIPKEHALLAKQLGNFPLWRGETDLHKTLESTYGAASEKAAEYLSPSE